MRRFARVFSDDDRYHLICSGRRLTGLLLTKQPTPSGTAGRDIVARASPYLFMAPIAYERQTIQRRKLRNMTAKCCGKATLCNIKVRPKQIILVANL